jgi:hypothetical protein
LLLPVAVVVQALTQVPVMMEIQVTEVQAVI